MAFGAWVQGTSKDAGSVTSSTLAYGSNVTAGNTLIICLRQGGTGGNTITVSDNLNGSWTKDDDQQVTSAGNHTSWRFSNTAAGACTVTITFNTAATMRWIQDEYTGNFVKDSILWAQGNSTAPSSGAQATSHTCAILGHFIGGGNTGANADSFTQGGNFTLREHVDLTAAVRTVVATEDWTAGAQAAGSYTADGTLALADNWGMRLLAYYDGGAVVSDSPLPNDLVDPQGWMFTSLVQNVPIFPDGTPYSADTPTATGDVNVPGILYAGIHPMGDATADRNVAGITYVGAVPYGPVTADRTVAGILHVGAPQVSTISHAATVAGILYTGPLAFTSGGFDYITTGILYATATPMGTVSHTASVAGILEAGVTPYSTVSHAANVAGLVPAGAYPLSTVTHDTSIAGILYSAAFALNGPSFDYNVAGILYVGAAQRTTATADRTVAGIVHAGPFQMSTVTASRNVVGIVELGVHAVATVTRSTSVPGLLEVAVYAKADLGPTVNLPGITDTVRRRDTGTILQVGTGTMRARQTGTMTGSAATGTMKVRTTETDSIEIL